MLSRPFVAALLAAALSAGAASIWIGGNPAPEAMPAAPAAPAVRVTYRGPHPPALTLPGGKVEPVRSVLNVPHTMKPGEFVWNDGGVPAGPVWIRVDLARQLLSVFRAGEEIGTAVILYGAYAKQTPSGTFPILERAAFHHSSLYDADMPYMLRLTADGVAIHASAVRRGAATHGCIGVPLAFAQKLFAVVHRGDPVAIYPESMPRKQRLSNRFG